MIWISLYIFILKIPKTVSSFSWSDHNFFIKFWYLPPEFLPVSGPLTWWCASILGTALLCNSGGRLLIRAYIIGGTTATWRPTFWIMTSHFRKLSDQYCSPKGYLNLGPLVDYYYIICLIGFQNALWPQWDAPDSLFMKPKS